MEKKKNTMKLTESQLFDFIEEGVNQTLKEYRGETYNDGDFNYTRPNGENNIGTGLNFSNYGKEGKRALTNMTMKDGDKLKTVSVNTRTVFHHGKGDICNRLLHTVKDTFYGNDKIEWTDAEKEEIEEILGKILALAALTKKEGNKKRGYDGPEKQEEPNAESSLDESKTKLTESQLRNHIYEKVKKRLNEYDDPEHLGGGRVFKKLSELTFDEIMSILGEKDHFNMHYDASDAMRHIGNEASFEQAKKQLMDKFGDVMMSINPEAEWFDKVKVEDEDWKKASAEYDKEKQDFLAGCKYTD